MNKKLIIAAAVILIVTLIPVSLFITGIIKAPSSSETTFPSEDDTDVFNPFAGKTIISENEVFQTLDGFGVSSYSWAKNVGNDNNADKIISLLFSEKDGIGLDIYRFYLGAGSENDTAIPPENRGESFMQSDGTLNFLKDANSVYCLEKANAVTDGKLNIALLAYSPPCSLTENGKAYSSPTNNTNSEKQSNLSPDNYDAYSDYLYNCAEYFVNKGYNVTSVYPVNEPQYSSRAEFKGDGSVYAAAEGCHYFPDELRDFLITLVNKFNGSYLHEKGVRIKMFESGEAEGQDSVFAEYLRCVLSADNEAGKKNKVLRKYFDSISVHSYWSSNEEKQSAAEFLREQFPGIKTECTQYSQKPNDGSNGVLEYIVNEGGETKGLTMEYALAMAKTIITDLTVLDATQWCWDKACSYSTSTDGLIYITENEDSPIEISKRLWALGNFSKFISPGAVRIGFYTGNDDISGVCFRNPDGDIVCIYLNPTSSVIYTNITDCPYNAEEIYVTDSEHDLESCDIVTNGTISLPKKSLTTIIFRNKEK